MKTILHTNMPRWAYGSSSDDLRFTKEIDLPIQPFVGLLITWDWHKTEISEFIVKEISYDVDADVLELWSEDDNQISSALRDERTISSDEIQSAVDAYLESGWTMKGKLE